MMAIHVDEAVLVNVASRSHRRDIKSCQKPTSPVFYADKAKFLPEFILATFSLQEGVIWFHSLKNSQLKGSKGRQKGHLSRFDGPN